MFTSLVLVGAVHAANLAVESRGIHPVVDCATLLTAPRTDEMQEILSEDDIKPLLADATAQALRAMRSAQAFQAKMTPRKREKINAGKYDIDDMLRPHDAGFIAGPTDPDDVTSELNTPVEFAAAVGRIARIREVPKRIARAYVVRGQEAIDRHLRETADRRAQIDAVTLSDVERAELDAVANRIKNFYPKHVGGAAFATVALFGGLGFAHEAHLTAVATVLAGMAGGGLSYALNRALDWYEEVKIPRHYWRRLAKAAETHHLGPYVRLNIITEHVMRSLPLDREASIPPKFTFVATGVLATRAAAQTFLEAALGQELDFDALAEARIAHLRQQRAGPDAPAQDVFVFFMDRIYFRSSANDEPTLLTIVRAADGDFKFPKARGNRAKVETEDTPAAAGAWIPGLLPAN